MKNAAQVVLPGGVKVYQDTGAPVTTDTLLLASSLHISPGSVVVDLGCGSGGGLVYCSILNPGCRWIGIDIRFDALGLMLDSGKLQDIPLDVLAVCCSVETVSLTFPESIADAVIMNPPYGASDSARNSPDTGRDRSRVGSHLLLYQFIKGAAHVLVSGGEFLIINKPSLLPEIMLGCRAFGINPLEIQPVGPPGRPAERIILKGKKDSRAGLEILPRTEASELLKSRLTRQAIQIKDK